MSTYRLAIITPNGKIFDDQVEFLSAPGTEGSFGVLNHHAPMVSTLRKGVVSIQQNNVEKFFALNSGVLEVDSQSNVLLLSDTVASGQSKEEAASKLNN